MDAIAHAVAAKTAIRKIADCLSEGETNLAFFWLGEAEGHILTILGEEKGLEHADLDDAD